MKGTLLQSRYRIGDPIGEGGMGVVYRGLDEQLDRDVAVKVLHPAIAQAPAARARFEREAKILARLQHPGAVQVFDYGHQEQIVFLVMELLRGTDLRPPAPLGTPEAIELALGWVLQVLEVLGVAHGLGIVHRDLKLSNLMLVRGSAEERVKVLDFGIAIVRDDSLGARITRTGLVTGTPTYMSPEQCRGEPLDGRSDLYAVGCILYALLTGRPPFDGEQAVEVVTHHLFTPVRPPREHQPSLSPALDEVVREALSKRREDRPPTAAKLREALLQAQADPTATRRPTRLAAASGRGTFPSPAASEGTIGMGTSAAATLPVLVLELGSVAKESDALCATLGASGFQATRCAATDLDLEATDSRLIVVVPGDGQSSQSLLEKLRSRPGAPPVLVCGAESDLAAMTRAIADGAFDFVSFPLDPPDLIRKVARAIRHSS